MFGCAVVWFWPLKKSIKLMSKLFSKKSLETVIGKAKAGKVEE
jgi:hypothetical protein